MVQEGSGMDRWVELEEYIQEYREQRLLDRKAYAAAHYKEMIPAFGSRLDLLIKEQIKRQNTGQQESIKYLTISRLRSSGYTESYELAIGMSNSTLHMDKNTSYVYWSPGVVYDSIIKDRKDAEKLLRRNFVGLTRYELFQLKQLLLNDDWKILQTVLGNITEETANIIAASSLRREEKIQVLCGDYMDQVNFVCSIETGRSIT